MPPQSPARTNIGGLWSGWYAEEGFGDAVPMTAWLDDRNGILAGSALEPDIAGLEPAADLDSALDGLREGTSFVLTKTYREGQGAPPVTILYEGEADAAFQHLSGTWTVAEAPIQSGPFAWSRAADPACEAVLRRVLTPADIDPAGEAGA